MLPGVQVAGSYGELCEAAAAAFAAAAREATAARARFMVALCGGSTPVGLYRRLAATPYREEGFWAATHLFWTDERWVPPDHPDSNYRLARTELLGQVAVPPQQVHPMPTGLATPEEGASRYTVVLETAFSLPVEGLPRFDLVLLGVGVDGHVASLFPGAPALYERRRLVVAVPAPGTEGAAAHARLTLTLPVFNAARRVFLLAAGAGKAEAVGRVLGPAAVGPAVVPAARVRPKGGSVSWFLDREAASLLEAPAGPSP